MNWTTGHSPIRPIPCPRAGDREMRTTPPPHLKRHTTKPSRASPTHPAGDHQPGCQGSPSGRPSADLDNPGQLTTRPLFIENAGSGQPRPSTATGRARPVSTAVFAAAARPVAPHGRGLPNGRSSATDVRCPGTPAVADRPHRRTRPFDGVPDRVEMRTWTTTPVPHRREPGARRLRLARQADAGRVGTTGEPVPGRSRPPAGLLARWDHGAGSGRSATLQGMSVFSSRW